MSATYLQLNLMWDRIASYPKGLRLSSDFFRHYPLRGGRRLQCLLRMLNHSHMDSLCMKDADMPLKTYDGLDVELFYRALDSVFKPPYHICFFWPSPKRSTGRLYAFVVNPSGDRMLAYLKIAVSKEDCDAVHREAIACNLLNTKSIQRFHVPQCLMQSQLGRESAMVLFEPIPLDARPLRVSTDSWSDIVGPCKTEFANTPVTLRATDIQDEPWYRNFLERSDPDAPFTRLAIQSFQTGVEVCLTHGDFACHNFRESKDTIWIIDWEECTPLGPFLADEICFFLCVRRFELKWSIKSVFRAFSATYLDQGDANWSHAVQAIAFLYGQKVSMGKEMVDMWNHRQNYVRDIRT